MKCLFVLSLATQLSVVVAAMAQAPCKSTVVGELHIEHFQSKIFDRMISVRVWLPAGYDDVTEATAKYPTLYMLDGQNALTSALLSKANRNCRLTKQLPVLLQNM
jgi:hypothetical protein